ncbi:MAG: efflux RND transporter periplasmic adaptor subunit [Opitutaceae bacterium]
MSLLRLLIAPVLLLAGCSRGPDAAPPDHAATMPVHTAVATSTRTARTQPVAGTVWPFARATIAAKVTGTVAITHLVVGQAVAAGEVLVTLQAAEIGARSEQAQAALAQAEREYQRENSLETKGASTADAVHATDDRRRQARAAAQEATAMLAYTQIAAPFTGVVTGERVKPGDLATPGRALFEIEGTDRFRAEVQVPGSLVLPPIGTHVAVVLDDATVQGQLVELSPAADPISRTRLAKIALPATAAARSGQFVRVLWPVENDVALTVPLTAVSVLGQMERVFVVTGGHAQLRLVKTGAHDGERVEIAAGLDAGETVVVEPPAALRDGQPVEIQR